MIQIFPFQPICLWMFASCLYTISFLLVITNWTVIFLAIIKDKTYCPKLFLIDGVLYKAIGSIEHWLYAFIGLIIICLLRIPLDKSQVGTFDLGGWEGFSEVAKLHTLRPRNYVNLLTDTCHILFEYISKAIACSVFTRKLCLLFSDFHAIYHCLYGTFGASYHECLYVVSLQHI